MSLLALVNHAQEQVAFSAKNCVNPHLKLNVAIEYIERCLAEHDSVLTTVLLQDFAIFMQGKRLSTPLLIEGLICHVQITYINRGIDSL